KNSAKSKSAGADKAVAKSSGKKASKVAKSAKSKSKTKVAKSRSRARLAQSKVFKMDPALTHFTPVSVQAATPLPRRSLSSMAAASGASGASFGQLFGLHHTQDPL